LDGHDHYYYDDGANLIVDAVRSSSRGCNSASRHCINVHTFSLLGGEWGIAGALMLGVIVYEQEAVPFVALEWDGAGLGQSTQLMKQNVIGSKDE